MARCKGAVWSDPLKVQSNFLWKKESGNGSPNQVSAKKNLKFMPDAGTSPPLPPQPSPLSPPPTTKQANALGDIKNFEGFGKAGVIPSSLADEDEKFLNSNDTNLPVGNEYDDEATKPGSVRLSELAAMERKLMEMKESRKSLTTSKR
ncbi:hypothetical protein TrCOL_g1433 [Triparma columacea]|uniref:Uncharacterized protein n=1 Tax=Triparma columacea TaxID=722753 RepID=A0A9W7GDZ5_9STRA|nr:hypothetical protein TrCOL_g1433 [Triparma columacea]